MNIDPGEMRTPIEVQSYTRSRNNTGGNIDAWNASYQGFAKIRGLTVREANAGGGTQTESQFRIFLRYRPGLKTKDRIKDLETGRIFNLNSVIDHESRHQWWDCLASQIGG